MNSEHIPILAEWEYLLTKLGFDAKIFWFLYFRKSKTKGPLNRRLVALFWNTFGKMFFKLYGDRLISRNYTQLQHIKIPYYPWFSNSPKVDSALIVAKKEPYIKMP